MRKLFFLVALAVIGAGQLKASPCATNTLAVYETSITTFANACTIGNLEFWLFNASPGQVTASGPGTSPFDATSIQIIPVNTASGIGLLIQPVTPGGFFANATGVRDVEMPFEVACVDGTACLSTVTMSITGSATAGSFGTAGKDVLTETYCAGGITPPPTAPCPPSGGGAVVQDILNITPGGPSTVSQTDTFSAVSKLSMNKDMGATGNNGTASITSVEDLFNAQSTPEPSTLLLLGSGLFGLVGFGRRKV